MQPNDEPLAFCVFCGRRIPDAQYVRWHRPKLRLYCSGRQCAIRQQVAIKRLRDTSPPEALT